MFISITFYLYYCESAASPLGFKQMHGTIPQDQHNSSCNQDNFEVNYRIHNPIISLSIICLYFLQNFCKTDLHTYTKGTKKEKKRMNPGELHLFVMWIQSRGLQSIQFQGGYPRHQQGLKWQQSFRKWKRWQSDWSSWNLSFDLLCQCVSCLFCMRLSSCLHPLWLSEGYSVLWAKPGFIVALRTECVCCCTNTLKLLVTAAPISQIHSILHKHIKHTLMSREYMSLDVLPEINGWLPYYHYRIFF